MAASGVPPHIGVLSSCVSSSNTSGVSSTSGAKPSPAGGRSKAAIRSAPWFWDALWTENSTSRLTLGIPDTVILSNGVPSKWLFTSARDGAIRKKTSSKLTPSTILDGLTASSSVLGGGSEMIAYVHSSSGVSKQSSKPLNSRALSDLLHYRPGPNESPAPTSVVQTYIATAAPPGTSQHYLVTYTRGQEPPYHASFVSSSHSQSSSSSPPHPPSSGPLVSRATTVDDNTLRSVLIANASAIVSWIDSTTTEQIESLKAVFLLAHPSNAILLTSMSGITTHDPSKVIVPSAKNVLRRTTSSSSVESTSSVRSNKAVRPKSGIRRSNSGLSVITASSAKSSQKTAATSSAIAGLPPGAALVMDSRGPSALISVTDAVHRKNSAHSLSSLTVDFDVRSQATNVSRESGSGARLLHQHQQHSPHPSHPPHSPTSMPVGATASPSSNLAKFTESYITESDFSGDSTPSLSQYSPASPAPHSSAPSSASSHQPHHNPPPPHRRRASIATGNPTSPWGLSSGNRRRSTVTPSFMAPSGSASRGAALVASAARDAKLRIKAGRTCGGDACYGNALTADAMWPTTQVLTARVEAAAVADGSPDIDVDMAGKWVSEWLSEHPGQLPATTPLCEACLSAVEAASTRRRIRQGTANPGLVGSPAKNSAARAPGKKRGGKGPGRGLARVMGRASRRTAFPSSVFVGDSGRRKSVATSHIRPPTQFAVDPKTGTLPSNNSHRRRASIAESRLRGKEAEKYLALYPPLAESPVSPSSPSKKPPALLAAPLGSPRSPRSPSSGHSRSSTHTPSPTSASSQKSFRSGSASESTTGERTSRWGRTTLDASDGEQYSIAPSPPVSPAATSGSGALKKSPSKRPTRSSSTRSAGLTRSVSLDELDPSTGGRQQDAAKLSSSLDTPSLLTATISAKDLSRLHNMSIESPGHDGDAEQESGGSETDQPEEPLKSSRRSRMDLNPFGNRNVQGLFVRDLGPEIEAQVGTRTWFRQDKDTLLPYLILENDEDPDGRRPTGVVVIGDVFDSIVALRAVFEPYVAVTPGAKVLLWHYPGQDWTMANSGATLNNDYAANALYALLKHIKDDGAWDFEREPFMLLGSGYGGCIASFIATAYADTPDLGQLSSLVLVNPYAFVDPHLSLTLKNWISLMEKLPVSQWRGRSTSKGQKDPVHQVSGSKKVDDAESAMIKTAFSSFWGHLLFSPEHLFEVGIEALTAHVSEQAERLTHSPHHLQLCKGVLASIDTRAFLDRVAVPVVHVSGTSNGVISPLHRRPFVQYQRGQSAPLSAVMAAGRGTHAVVVLGGHSLLHERARDMMSMLHAIARGDLAPFQEEETKF